MGLKSQKHADVILEVMGHSRTTWTKFYPILPNFENRARLIEWTIVDIFHKTYSLFMWTIILVHIVILGSLREGYTVVLSKVVWNPFWIRIRILMHLHFQKILLRATAINFWPLGPSRHQVATDITAFFFVKCKYVQGLKVHVFQFQCFDLIGEAFQVLNPLCPPSTPKHLMFKMEYLCK